MLQNSDINYIGQEYVIYANFVPLWCISFCSLHKDIVKIIFMFTSPVEKYNSIYSLEHT